MDQQSNTTEEPIEFADFNAKLLVLDVLCYDLDVLDPYDPDAEDETDEDLDVDGQDDRAREYYDDLDLLPSHLSLVTEITVDSDLEVLQDVHPGWDGSDDRFDPQNWDDLLDLTELRTVYAAAPLPAHVAERLATKGVEVRSA
ncbi:MULTISPECIES: DUF6892 domain-containing protein [Curtobacterium]|uniref:DUF6892 domain-containing protein n=1 Tax=Curtobacterium poinsettiae TaxID=159612 RepID=A0ABT3S0P9_9MICO|nr:hypothetical protein [Curtobacterium flaccumfaciens]MBT1611494.1 hypothetical protein [Curtobacterium flaccumfaciens pv. poinsettiae]MCS6575600.1 hypothetical protein [Curtobacterium flaccumfaciens pv. flaccumfaciens]MCX2847876.1 hypothetical protein [Curtobacterium flaccumfaciens pv. poinsettiae]TPG08757.1 hypothetical protein EAH85_00100 [Curtobacterium flaccumfaciens]UXN17044.1 hypothetical protein N8D78_09100 [Curtobacterium flaccumfaciens pv. poinsettiae]